MFLNTLPGNSTQKEHQLLLPLATCFPSLTWVHSLFLCQGCAVQDVLMVPFFPLQCFPCLCEMSNLLKTILLHGKPWTLDTTEMRKNSGQSFFASQQVQQNVSPFLINKGYSSLWVTTSLLGCQQNQNTPSPSSVQLLNIPITDTGTFSRPKGHQPWRAVQMLTAAQRPVSTQLARPLVLNLSSTRWK